MSRTDKTDPLWVQVMDPHSGLTEEVHDHRHGICDIDTWDFRHHGIFWRRDGYCYKTLRDIRKWNCGCSWCSRKSWSNWDGAHRVEWIAQRQAWLKGVGEDRVERDIPNYK